MKPNTVRKIRFKIPEDGLAIFRAVPNLRNVSYCDNFSTYTISNGVYSPNFATIITENIGGEFGCNVSVSGFPTNIAGVSILRRNVTRGPRESFKKLTDSLRSCNCI